MTAAATPELAALHLALIARAVDETYARELLAQAPLKGCDPEAARQAWEMRQQQDHVQTVYSGGGA